MRHAAHHPTPSPVPPPVVTEAGERNDARLPPLDPAAIARFNDVLHAVHPDAPHIDATRLRVLATWLLELDPPHARRELHQRLARLRELHRLADDVDWDTDPAHRARLLRLLDHVDNPDDDAIDHAPTLGRLADALLVELAWPAFADEVEDYLDFCRFRHEQHPLGAPPLKRSAWNRMRLAAGPLWQQLRRVPQTHFVEERAPRAR
jgi:hypothetical protein